MNSPSRVKIGRAKQSLVTADRLKRLLSFNSETGVFTWNETRSRTKAGSVAGSVNTDGYLAISIDKNVYLSHRLAWLYVYGEWPSMFIDHINGQRTDNSIKNLRQVTPSQNQQNSKVSKANTSGTRGVSQVKSSGNWKAQIEVDGARTVLGTYQTKEEAIAARKAAEVVLHTHRKATNV